MSSLGEEAGFMDFPPYGPWGGDQSAGWAFTDGSVSLAGLKEFAATQGKEWTDVGLMTRFVIEHERPWVEAIEEKQRQQSETLLPVFQRLRAMILEREREEIVEAIPWAD